MIGNIFEELNKSFLHTMHKSEINRLEMFREFAAFYNNDYEVIQDYLKKATLNNPYSAKTLETLKFRHLNIIGKIVNRTTSGIFLKDPVITTTDDKLMELLKQIRFFVKVKEAFKKAVYFNTVEAHVVWDDGIRIDIITPDNYAVKTKLDYLKKEAIGVNKTDTDNTIYTSVWTETDHYLIKGGKVLGVEGNNGMVNPYIQYARANNMSALPFVTLRMQEGLDYYGEPNWNIFLSQKNFDVRLTDLNETELKTLHQIYFGVNTGFSKDETFKPGQFKQVNNVQDNQVPPSIDSITADVDYTSVRENVDWLFRLVMNSEGISGGSASTDLDSPESGASKMMDEVELIEKREEYKGNLYYFILNLLGVIRMVNNTYNPQALKVEKNEVKFIDNNVWETVNDKKTRYELGTQYGYLDAIDIAQEELEISEEEAIKRIQERKQRNITVPAGTEDEE